MPNYVVSLTFPTTTMAVGTYIIANGIATADGGTPGAYSIKGALTNGSNSYENQDNFNGTQSWSVRVPGGTGTADLGTGYSLSIEMIVGGATVATASATGLSVTLDGASSGDGPMGGGGDSGGPIPLQ